VFEMMDIVLYAAVVVSLFYTSASLVGWLFNLFSAKCLADKKTVQNGASRLISLVILRWGELRKETAYEIVTGGYVVTIKKK